MPSDSFLADNPHTIYDIGLKRDNQQVTFRGNLRNLTIIGRALTADELADMSGEGKYFLFTSVYFSVQ